MPIQIWATLIAIQLLKLLEFRSRFNWSLSNLAALLRWDLFTHKCLGEKVSVRFPKIS
jgi:hypothetical protein